MNRNEKKLLDTFANKVRVLRAKMNLTQEQLAAELDVDVRTVKRIEAGEYNPSLTKVLKLSELFGVELKDLLS